MADIQKVLVLGASGDQGLPLVAALLDQGAEAVSYTHLTLPTIYSV